MSPDEFAQAHALAMSALLAARVRRELASGTLRAEDLRADIAAATLLLDAVFPPDRPLPPGSPIAVARTLVAGFMASSLGPRAAP